MKLTVVLCCHFEGHVFPLQLLVGLLQIADVVNGFAQDGRLVQLPVETKRGAGFMG